MVRFANEMEYYTFMELDVNKLEKVMKFSEEIFGTINGVRIAMKREDYEQLKTKDEQVN
jgi:predicted enzyme related to lactoylglutathione lyase